jgi:hypothetical protein
MTEAIVHEVVQAGFGFDLYKVTFDVLTADRGRLLYEAAVNVVAQSGAAKETLFEAAEKAARSWGAFGCCRSQRGIDHHLYDRVFVGRDVLAICQVDGATDGAMRSVGSVDRRQNFD